MSGIYIHIPFCKQACNYCNFHFATSLKQKSEMIDALIKEISITSSFFNTEQLKGKESISTIYFGGGTPSILTTEDLTLIMAALQNRFVFEKDIEITLEANPDDITNNTLIAWQKIGINRLSVGIQSFSEEELIWMHRAHTAAESLICIDKIKDAGFSNFSIDLIYGSPLLSNDGWKRNVDTVINKDIPHISCYALTVEPKTALDKLITLQKRENVDPEKQATQFLLLMNWLEEAGYEHYEISNYAKPGFRSRHNSSYWSGDTYYGFGPSAHSFNGKERKWNVSNNATYISSIQKGIIPSEKELLTVHQQLNEYIMTSLRTMEGLNLELIKKQFGMEAMTTILVGSKKWELSDKIKNQNQQLILTKEGKLFADGIAADLFF
ncbi:MAG: radical SAM family heme chaperone HemW [Ferruginibacter sp.]